MKPCRRRPRMLRLMTRKMRQLSPRIPNRRPTIRLKKRLHRSRPRSRYWLLPNESPSQLAKIFRGETFGLRRRLRTPVAVLLICLPPNGNAQDAVKSEMWQSYAKQNGFVLAAVSFGSDRDLLKTAPGDTHPGIAVENLLINGLQATFGSTPLILYGRDAGGTFAATFANWHPEKSESLGCIYRDLASCHAAKQGQSTRHPCLRQRIDQTRQVDRARFLFGRACAGQALDFCPD